jgi:metal-responsive CopG/Arc/MetJ family transcriptional regulator
MPKLKVSMSIDEGIVSQLDDLAANEGLNRSEMAERILRDRLVGDGRPDVDDRLAYVGELECFHRLADAISERIEGDLDQLEALRESDERAYEETNTHVEIIAEWIDEFDVIDVTYRFKRPFKRKGT